MLRLSRLLFPVLGLLLLSQAATGGWLSDAVGINIDLAKAVGGVPTPLNAAQQPSEIVRTPSVVSTIVPMATADDVAGLQKRIDLTLQNFKAESDRYQSYAAISVFATIGLGLIAAIAGFLRKAVAAGILSLVAVASTGVAKAFPISDRATYYQTLYGETLSLQVETSLAGKMTVEEYNKRVARLITILQYASKLPGMGDARPVLDELIKTSASQQKH